MSFQKISDINGNDNINNGETVENKLEMKKLTKRDNKLGLSCAKLRST
jgi:hypothetical protein